MDDYEEFPRVSEVAYESVIDIGKIYGRVYLSDIDNWPFLNAEVFKLTAKRLKEEGITLEYGGAIVDWIEICSNLYGDEILN